MSIVINNYNYGHFLRQAIDSALRQAHEPLEVIIVDDGSTDSSQEIINEYGNQIISVFKENGGQASALNVGFARSHGSVVIFLDADDTLLPDLVQRVASEYQRRPDLALLAYRLAIIDEAGYVTGSTIPPAYLTLPSGDWANDPFANIMNCATWSPTSGNAFAAQHLHKIMPIPETSFRLSADYFLCRMAALCGPVANLRKIGGYYRLHGANAYYISSLDLPQLRHRILFVQNAFQQIRTRALSIGIDIHDNEILDEIDVAQRIVSYKLAPQHHPLRQDTLPSLARRGIVAAQRRPDLPALQKAIHTFWFVAICVSPPALAKVLAEKFFSDARKSVNRVLSTATRAPLHGPNAPGHGS